MYWIVQENFFSSAYFNALCDELENQGIDYSCVQVSSHLKKIAPEVKPTQTNVFVMGSSTLGAIAEQQGWLPGYFSQGLDYQLYLEHYGRHMLNHEAIVVPLNQAQPKWEHFFMRPVSDKKSFSGSVMSNLELKDMQQSAQDGNILLAIDDLVVIAPLQTIYAEYRFWVVDEQIVTCSRYKLGQQVVYMSQVDEHIVAYAQEQVKRWQPNRAFVIDIADTQHGLKVIEINAINSSAFYAGDIAKLVKAIEQMEVSV